MKKVKKMKFMQATDKISAAKQKLAHAVLLHAYRWHTPAKGEKDPALKHTLERRYFKQYAQRPHCG